MPGDGWLRQKFRKFAEEMEKAVKQRQIAQIKEHPEQSDEVLDERNFLKNFDGAGGKLA